MRRGLYAYVGTFLLMGSLLLAGLTSRISFRPEAAGVGAKSVQGTHTITITPWGPDQATIDGVKGNLDKNPAVQRYLKGTRYRMLYFEFVEPAAKASGRSQPPNRYRATFYDYTNNKAIVAEGLFNDSRRIQVSESIVQPTPGPEEFEAAVAILSQDPVLGPAIRKKSLEPYPAMPPLVDGDLANGKVERTLSVGLMPRDGKDANEVIGVNMIRESVVRFPDKAPETSYATEMNCGVPNAGQPTTSRGTAGQFQLTIARDGITLWEFLVIRPSASSGTNASGIELRDVKYLGKLVFSRAHAPILNVQYQRNACGPFRDWSWQEGMFTANGTDVAPGIRICTDNPQTVLESGNDTGNFRGVAIYDREEVRLVSELNAGWYRYISEWRFHDDGVIQPLFGYGATENSCVCRLHTHHVYWRFDFDIVTAANNKIFEITRGIPKLIEFETKGFRNAFPEQHWVVENSVTGQSCIIEPGRLDGNSDKFGVADLWLLRSNFPNEIDDGPGRSEVRLDPFVNGESLVDQDVVVWYGGHWAHERFDGGPNIAAPDQGSPNHDSPDHSAGPHVQGPVLRLLGY